MNNRFVVILIACVAIFLGLIFFTKKDANAPTTETKLSEHVQGEGTSGVTLIEYGDFECPTCGLYYPILKEVKAKYGDQITFQFRHFPIVSSHPNAMSAHRAAEAAGLQGKFWEMHDMLFERQQSWRDSKSAASLFKSYAEELGLNTEQYTSDVLRASVGSVIQADLKEGQKIGVQGTPTFVLNGKVLTDAPRDIEGFSKVIDEAITQQEDN